MGLDTDRTGVVSTADPCENRLRGANDLTGDGMGDVGSVYGMVLGTS